MTSLHPQGQSYFPPQAEDNRRRSSSAADRYRPRAYSGTPSFQPDPHLLGPHHVPSPLAGPVALATPPYPVDAPMSSCQMNMPVAPRQVPATEAQYRRNSAASFHQEAPRRPSYTGSTHDRRMSHESRRSHHSHHSHHSHLSEVPRHDDRRRRRGEEEEDEVYDGSDSDERDKDHHHHHHHKIHSTASDLADYRQRQKDRGENVSRSLGDSLMSVFYPIKYLWEPRDKY